MVGGEVIFSSIMISLLLRKDFLTSSTPSPSCLLSLISHLHDINVHRDSAGFIRVSNSETDVLYSLRGSGPKLIDIKKKNASSKQHSFILKTKATRTGKSHQGLNTTQRTRSKWVKLGPGEGGPLQGRAQQLVILCQMVCPENIPTGSIM